MVSSKADVARDRTEKSDRCNWLCLFFFLETWETGQFGFTVVIIPIVVFAASFLGGRDSLLM